MDAIVSALGLGAVGLLGALIGEVAEISAYVKREHRLPWEVGAGWRGRQVKGQHYPSLRTHLVATTCKGMVGFTLVAVEVWGEQISGPIGAFTIGAASVPIMTRLAAQVPTGELSNETSNEAA